MNKEIFKKIKNHKMILNKNNIKNGRINIKLNNINKKVENFSNFPDKKIKSKSTNKFKSKLKLVNGMNKFPTIKLPVVNNKSKIKLNNNNANDNLQNITMNNLKLKKYLEKDNTTKIGLKTNKSFTLNKKFHSNQNSKNLLISKIRDTSYNFKRDQKQNSLKNTKTTFITNPNMGLTRIFDRKKLQESKSKIFQKHNFKIFKDNKLVNNNLNKSINKIKFNKSNNKKKIKALFEFDKNDEKMHNYFNRNNLKTEITDENISENKIEQKDFDIISDISLGEEELNFSEEDSIDNMEFSLEDEEI